MKPSQAESRVIPDRELAELVLRETNAAIVVCDPASKIVVANDAADALRGGHVIGRAFDEVFALTWLKDGGGPAGERVTLARALGGDEERGLAIWEPEGQAPVEFDVRAAPYRGPDGTVDSCIVTLQDVTATRDLQRRMRIQYEISHVLATSNNLAEAGPRILREMCTGLGWDYGAIWQVDRARYALRLLATWAAAENAEQNEFLKLTQESSLELGAGLPGRVSETGEAEWVEELEAGTNFPRVAAARAVGLRSGFAFPFLSGGEVVGVLEAFTRRHSQPTPSLFRMMHVIGSQIGLFLLRQTSQLDRARLAALVDDSRDAILSKDLDGIIQSWNPAAERLYGYRAEEIIGRPVSLLFPPERAGDFELLMGQVRRGDAVESYDTVRMTKDGRRKDVAVTISPLRDSSGQIVGASTISRDVTERKVIEGARIRAINLLKAVIDGATDAIYAKDAEGRYILLNFAAAEALGHAPDEVIGKRAEDFLDAKTAAALRAEDVRIMQRSIAETLENVIPHAAGTRVYQSNKAPFRDEAGNVLGIVGISRDITNARRAEAELARQAALLDLSPDAINVHDLEGRITFWNRGAEKMYGWTAEEAIGQTSHALLATEVPAAPEEIDADLRTKGYWEGELTQTARRGRRLTVASRQIVQQDERGEPTAILEINEDIGERRRREQAELFLANATEALTVSLDLKGTLENLVQLALPYLGDWCAVHLVEDHQIQRMAFRHRDPAVTEQVARRPQVYPLDTRAMHLVPYVVRTGQAEIQNEVSGTLLEEAARDESHLETLKQLGLSAYLCLPLVARGRMLGAVTFARGTGGEGYREDEVEMARELVRRAGLAVDNARLYRQSEVARARMQLVAEASVTLMASLEYESRIERLTGLVVPRFADGCAVNILEADGTIRLAALAHANPERGALWRQWAEQFPLQIDAESETPRVLRSGQAEWDFDVKYEPEGAARSEALEARRQFMTRLGIHSYLVVPLVARGRTFGAMTFVRSEGQTRYTFEDLLVAEELARRAAFAMDNAALYQQEQQARRNAEDSAARLQALQHVSTQLASALTRQEVGAVVLREGIAPLGAVAGLVGQLTPDGREIELLSDTGHAAEIMQRWRHFPVEARTPMGDVIRSGEMLQLESLEAVREHYPLLAREGWEHQAWLFAPLEIDGRVFGVLEFAFNSTQRIDSADRDFVRALAQQCAQALERARLYEQEQVARQTAERAAARSEWLTEASHVLSSSLEYENTLKQVAQLAVPELADWCQIHIALPDGTAEQLVMAHKDPAKIQWAEDLQAEIQQYFEPDWNAPTGLPHVLRTGLPEIYYDIPDELLVAVSKNEVQLKILRDIGYSSVMIVPLTSQDRTLGAITFVNTESRRHFTDQDLEFAELLAGRAAVAIENARLYRETQELNAELEARVEERTYELSEAYRELRAEVVERSHAEETTRALLRISSKLNSTLDVPGAFDQLIREATTLVNGERGFVALRTARGLTVNKVIEGETSREVEYTWGPGVGIPGWVMERGEPYVTNDVENDPLVLHRSGINSDVRSIACTPIVDRDGKVMGVFEVQNKRGEAGFSAADVEFLMALSPIASIAIGNALAYEKVLNAEKALKDSYLQLRALAARLQTVREEERTDIARELHDELGQALTALKMDVASLASRLPKRSQALHERARNMSEQIDATIMTVRRLSTQLRPGMLDDLGLGPSIEWYANDFAARTGITCEVEIPAEELELERLQATALFRIFQETLTNVARHAAATEVKGSLKAQDGVLILQVRDNGQGMELEQVRGRRSLGLLGMRERAEMLEGTLDIQSAPGQGTIVTVEMPLRPPEQR